VKTASKGAARPVAAWVALCTLTLAEQAFAQQAAPKPESVPAVAGASEPKKDAARGHFEQGLKLVEQGAFDAALVEFRKSIADFPTKSASQNAAVMLRRLARYDEASDAWDAMIANFPNLKEEELAFIDTERKALRQFLGFMMLKGGEPGATVVVDGLERGTLPLSAPLRVSAGTRTVRVYKEGFLPFEQRTEVGAQATTEVGVTLGALIRGGRLQVTESQGAKVDVLVDGIRVGATPWQGTVAAGKHVVSLRKGDNEGSPPASVNVALNQMTTLGLLSEPLLCRVRVEPTPSSANVAFDGVDVGQGVWTSNVRCGGHQVEVAAPGFIANKRILALRENTPATLRETLERDPNSAEYRRINPPHVIFAVNLGVSLAPTLGGDLANDCQGTCDASVPIGMQAKLAGGYQLGSGLGFGLSVGALTVGRIYNARPETLEPVQNLVHQGRVRDDVALRGPVIGGFVGFKRGGAFAVSGRLGFGALLGFYSVDRTGYFTTPRGSPYTTVALQESGFAAAPYIEPEVRVHARLTSALSLEAGVSAMGLFSLDANAQWRDKTLVPAGDRASSEYRENGGITRYGQQSVLGGVLFLITPSVGLGLEL
jgi:hypothetical protein